MKLYLIRHGQTEANARNLYYGSSDLPLTESGVKGILERVNRGIYPPAQGLRRITSGLIRAQQTYKLIYDGLDYEVEPDFNEMDFGDFEMHSYEELKTWPSYVQWISDYFKNRCPNGESVEDMRARVYRALTGCCQPGRYSDSLSWRGDSCRYGQALSNEGKTTMSGSPAPARATPLI
jgi:broad specificity phosphatase PhoE